MCGIYQEMLSEFKKRIPPPFNSNDIKWCCKFAYLYCLLIFAVGLCTISTMKILHASYYSRKITVIVFVSVDIITLLYFLCRICYMWYKITTHQEFVTYRRRQTEINPRRCVPNRNEVNNIEAWEYNTYLYNQNLLYNVDIHVVDEPIDHKTKKEIESECIKNWTVNNMERYQSNWTEWKYKRQKDMERIIGDIFEERGGDRQIATVVTDFYNPIMDNIS